jgi:hypothetical protein
MILAPGLAIGGCRQQAIPLVSDSPRDVGIGRGVGSRMPHRSVMPGPMAP